MLHYVLTDDAWKQILLAKYKWITLVATTFDIPDDSSRMMKRAYNIQKELEIQRISAQLDELMNLHKINHISLAGGSCKRCRECSQLVGKACKKPHLKQTSMEAVGIDCQKTFNLSGFDFEMPNYTYINRGAAILHNEESLSTLYLKKKDSFQKMKSPTIKDAQQLSDQLLNKNHDLFESIEIFPISDLDSEKDICTERCSHYGKNFSCPPYSKPIDLESWRYFALWKWKSNKFKKRNYNAALKVVHSGFFSLGYYFSLSLRDCYCNECKICKFSDNERTGTVAFSSDG